MDLHIKGHENGSHFAPQPRKLHFTFYNWLLQMDTFNFTRYINWLLPLVTTHRSAHIGSRKGVYF